jgi:hypothetical protein
MNNTTAVNNIPPEIGFHGTFEAALTAEGEIFTSEDGQYIQFYTTPGRSNLGFLPKVKVVGIDIDWSKDENNNKFEHLVGPHVLYLDKPVVDELYAELLDAVEEEDGEFVYTLETRQTGGKRKSRKTRKGRKPSRKGRSGKKATRKNMRKSRKHRK